MFVVVVFFLLLLFSVWACPATAHSHNAIMITYFGPRIHSKETSCGFKEFYVREGVKHCAILDGMQRTHLALGRGSNDSEFGAYICAMILIHLFYWPILHVENVFLVVFPSPPRPLPLLLPCICCRRRGSCMVWCHF